MVDFGIKQVHGDQFALKVTDPRHFGGEAKKSAADGGFAALMLEGMSDVNTKQNDYATLSQKALLDPKSVDVHDITIAGAEANLSLNIAKNVIDRVIRAYRDITTLR